jgi:hypothetical protein
MTNTLSPREMAVSAAAAVREATGISSVDLAITLGSGWRSADQFIGETVAVLDASAVPGFRSSPVPGRASVLKIMRSQRGATILTMDARTHLYEGHGIAAVTHGVRTCSRARRPHRSADERSRRRHAETHARTSRPDQRSPRSHQPLTSCGRGVRRPH